MYKINFFSKNQFFGFFLFFSVSFLPTNSQTILAEDFYKDLPFYLNEEQIRWTENNYDSLSLDDKIGQLFMVAAYSNKDKSHEDEIRNLIDQHKIGGLIFMQGTPTKQIILTNSYQSISKIPLLISMDAEWGAGMRLNEVDDLPWSITLGAMQNNMLVFDYGAEIASQLKMLGVHVNFGPVVDVNTNPKNPIIGSRSFGSNVKNVSEKGIQYAKGMQENGILACAKHFPGHGDTSSDSHKTLPTINQSLQRIENVELVPFQRMIDEGIGSIMVAHLNIPSLEKEKNTPSSLSKNIVTDLLKEKMGFKGLIITDALNMKGVTDYYPKGEVDLKAFKAGNDILLFSQSVVLAKERIKESILNGEISMLRIEESVKKILMAKYAVGLHQKKELSNENIVERINSKNAKLLKLKIADQAITTIKNNNNLLPFSNLYKKKIAYVNLGSANGDLFVYQLKKFANITQVRISSADQISSLSSYDYVVVGIHQSNKSPFVSSLISENDQNIAKEIAKKRPSVLCLFSSPYGLKAFDTSSFNSIIVAYQNSNQMQFKVPEVLFGASSSKGLLPVDIDSNFKSNQGIKLTSIQILGNAMPIEVSMSQDSLMKIDSIALRAISDKIAPGMQILVARHGKVIYDKNFGRTKYIEGDSITSNHLYDVASVTKIVSTLPMIMKAVGEDKLNINDSIGAYLSDLVGTNKSAIKIKDILGHQAGLVPWIPFYTETVDTRNAKPYLDYYRRNKGKDFSVKINDNLYLLTTFKDTIYKRIYDSPLGEKTYKYSDLGFYLMQSLIQNLYNQKLDYLAEENFYKDLNMYHTSYNPLNNFESKWIVPTEQDTYFRNELVKGTVHDQGAILLDGVAGHAGIFSNARDMAIIMQMYLNGGYYKGKKFLEKSVLDEFTSYHFKNNKSRRGYGFDKQQIEKVGPTCGCTTEKSFGHQGFTGTMVWSDPGEDLVYIFLSNRIHPSAENNKISNLNVRSNIQKVIYQSIL